MSRSERLPDADRLLVEEDKLAAYLLNPLHKDGASKAKFFSNWGFRADEWEAFAAALKVHGASQTVTSVERTKHGRKFTVECRIETPDGKSPCVLSVWIQQKGQPPRLVTAHPNS